MLSKVTVVAAAVAFLLAPSVSAFPSNCSRNYTVVSGDICDSISAAHNSSTYQLAVINRDEVDATCSNLMPGQVICLGTTVAEDCQTTYVVKSGDGCDAIETKFAVNATILLGNNPNIHDDCSNIYPGEVLCVAGQHQAPPTPPGFFSPTTSVAAPATSSTTVPVSTNAVVTNNNNGGSTDGSSDDIDWVVVYPGDDGYDESLPICGDDA